MVHGLSADRRSRRCLAITVFMLTTAALAGATSDAPGDPVAPWTLGAACAVRDAGVVRAQALTLDSAALASVAVGDRVRLDLPDGDAVTGLVERRNAMADGRYTVAGRIDTGGPARFLFAAHDTGFAGHLQIGASTYRLRGAGDGTIVIEVIDEAALPWCDLGAADAGALELPDDPPAALVGGGIGPCDDGAIVDLLVVYTREARNAAGGTANILAEIDLMVATMNQAFESSDVFTRMHLVYARELSTPQGLINLSTLTNPFDGVIDGVHLLRDAYGADQVALVDSGGGGVANGLDSLQPHEQATAFCRNGRNSLPFIIAHEVGHNLGCCHAVGDGGGCGVGLLFDYSNGHRFVGDSGTLWRTVMAYNPGVRVDIYSNPFLTFDGTPQGIRLEDAPGAYNALTIDIAAPVVATWRPSSPICEDLDLAADAADCNGNDVPDACEIALGLSHDVDHDGLPDECLCPVDIDLDGGVDFTDLLAVFIAYGEQGGPEDVDGSGFVDDGDVALVLSEWGRCVPVNGACCLPDQLCARETPAMCAAIGGAYQGDGTACDACPIGACCFVMDGCCTMETEGACVRRGGTFRGAGTTCDAECPVGACCIFDQSVCVETLEATCGDLGGTFRGAATTCDIECPAGTCCLIDGSCVDTLLQGCADLGGIFRAGAACPAACEPADVCADALAVAETTIEYTTRFSSSDGPPLPPTCDEGGGVTFWKDVWIIYVASCDGEASASVCDSDFDTRLAVYSADGCPGAIIACSDDACGTDGTRSAVTFAVDAGSSYLVRIGSGSTVGDGTLVIECSSGD